MLAEKISVSLPSSMAKFIEQYRVTHACRSRSDVLQRALELLQQNELEAAYKEANLEITDDFEVTTADGLNDEAW